MSDTKKWSLASFLFFKIFKHPNFEIQNGDFLMSKFLQIFQVSFLEYKEQLFLLDKLQNHEGLQVINSGINSNLNLP
jgi:hypothetical protein